MNEIFRKFAQAVSEAVGTPWASVIAITIILIWALTGPLFQFSETWQLTINTGTTIITFLMIFLVQNTQNRDAKATQLKLDELIRAIKEASNDIIDAENLPDKELKKHIKEMSEIRNNENSNPY
jgi:low affinity Fe/Cu permease